MALISFCNLVFSHNTFALYTPTLSASVDNSAVSINGNQVINLVSQTSELPIQVTVNTNNKTGYTATLNTETNETALVNADSASGAKIDSISTDLALNNLPNNTWGYKFGSSINYAPIPALSTPAQIVQTQGKTNGNELNQLSIGMKLADNLESGNYQNKLILSFISNPYTMCAVMTNGPDFNARVGKLDVNTGFASWDSSVAMMTNIRYVKKSTIRPGISQAVINIEDPDSDYEILAWFDVASGTIYYYADTEKIELNKNSSYLFHNFSGLQEMDMQNFDGKNIENMRDFFANCLNLVSVNFAGFNTSKVNNMTAMFFANFALKSLNLSSFDTSNVVYMNDMFSEMRELIDLNLSSFNTGKVEIMVNMFSGVRKIKNLNVSNFDTRNVKKTRNMFANMLELESLNISNFDTSKVEDMAMMFAETHKLKTLNLGRMNTSRVTSMEKMFNNMWALENLDVSSFDTRNVDTMRGMFLNDASLVNLNLSSFDTRKVTDMGYMFYGMKKINSLDLSSFITSKVTDMFSMFFNTYNLKTLDISNFETGALKDARYIFYTDGAVEDKLERIYANNDFDTSSLAESNGMFINRKKLRGGNGSYLADPSTADKTWLRVDRPGVHGYFTRKS